MDSAVIKVPKDIRSRVLKGIDYEFSERNEIFAKFTNRFLKINAEDPENFKNVIVHLDKILDKKVRNQNWNNTEKKLSYRKRKELGLYSLGKKSLNYQEVLPLNKLWLEYMTEYLNLEELRQQDWTNSCDDHNFEQISLKLHRADYHGSVLTVSKSSCPSYVGLKGIIVMETKNCFKLLGSDNILRTIPKASCIFTFKIDEFQFTFYGKNFQVKPAERSSKKIKTVRVSDLQL